MFRDDPLLTSECVGTAIAIGSHGVTLLCPLAFVADLIASDETVLGIGWRRLPGHYNRLKKEHTHNETVLGIGWRRLPVHYNRLKEEHTSSEWCEHSYFRGLFTGFYFRVVLL